MLHIGSTIEELSVRMARHRGKYSCYFKGTYPYITAIWNFERIWTWKLQDWTRKLTLTNLKSRAELEEREGHHVRKKRGVNRTHIGRTSKEYYWEHVEEKKVKNNIWRDNNKEYKKEQDTEYRNKHKEDITKQLKETRRCECWCWVSLRNMASHKKTTKHQELTVTNLPKWYFYELFIA